MKTTKKAIKAEISQDHHFLIQVSGDILKNCRKVFSKRTSKAAQKAKNKIQAITVRRIKVSIKMV